MKYYLFGTLFILALGVIVWIVIKKWPDLSNFTPEEGEDSELKEKQEKVKERLIETKLKKNIKKAASSFGKILKGGIGKAGYLTTKGMKIFSFIDKIHFDKTNFDKLQNIKLPKRKERSKKQKKGEVRHQNDLQYKLTEAELFLKRRQFEEAEECFIEVLKEEPKNVTAYLGLGDVYVALKDWESAEEAFRYIIKIDKKNIEGHRQLCNVYKTSKKWTEICTLCEELVEVGHEQSWIYANLGLAYKKTGYPEKAEVQYKKAVEIEPQNEELLDLLIEVAIINKNKELAIKCLNTLMGVSRDQIKLQDYRNKIDII